MNHLLSQPVLIDAGREPGFNVHWRARLLLPDGRAIDVRVKDISDSGMGLTSRDPVPAGATLAIALRVPDPGGSAAMTEISGQVKVAYAALRGYEFGAGLIWVERTDATRALISRWIAKLRYAV